MKRKIVSGIVLGVLLIGMSAMTPNIRPVKAEPRTIIVPDDFSSIQEAINNANDGDMISVKAGTYYEHIIVNTTVTLVGENKSTTIVDGNGTGTVISITANNVNITGFTIQNSGWAHFGIKVEASGGNTISNNDIKLNWDGVRLAERSFRNVLVNNNITNNTYGILLRFSSANALAGNKITDNRYGIVLRYSSDNTLRNNVMLRNRYNFGVMGQTLSEYLQDIDASNTVDGKPVYYWINRQNQTVPSNAGYVALINSTNIIVNGLNLKNGGDALQLAYTKNSIITNNNITDNWYGIWLWGSSGNKFIGNSIKNNSGSGIFLLSFSDDNTFVSNDIKNNERGIVLYISGDNTLMHNNIANNGYGIMFRSSHNNIIKGNKIANNSAGIKLWHSSSNVLVRNDIKNNWLGMQFEESYDNTFHHNNFINNTQQIYDPSWDYPEVLFPSINIWDYGYPSGGNYWSDYVGVDLFSGFHQNVTGSDGIGDTPYVIDENNQDNYPLINPYVPSLGDLNDDRQVDIRDIAIAALAFGSYPDHPRWNPIADINQDGKVDIRDLVLIAINYGKKYT